MSHNCVTGNLSLEDKQPLSQVENCQFTFHSGTRPITKRSFSSYDGFTYVRPQRELQRKKLFLQSLKSGDTIFDHSDKNMAVCVTRQRNTRQCVEFTLNHFDSAFQKSQRENEVSHIRKEDNAKEFETLQLLNLSTKTNDEYERRIEENEFYQRSAVTYWMTRSSFRTGEDIFFNLFSGQKEKLWEKTLSKRTKRTSFSNSSPRLSKISSLFFILLLITLHCNRATAIPIRWDLGPFSPCSVTCGRGVQNRSVICREMPEGFNRSSFTDHYLKGKQMPDMMCPAPKPHETQVCSQTACAPEWVYGAWEKCSRNCGRGIQIRIQRCLQKLGTGDTVRVHDHYCPKNKSFIRRHCNRRRQCPPRWMVSQWKPCPTTCGSSFQSRIVFCGQYRAGHSRPNRLPLQRCLLRAKPSARKICHMHKCMNTPRPTIRTGAEEFVQKEDQIKVRLLVGQQASVFSGTIIIIKCLADDFPKDNIVWYFDGQKIPRSKDRSEKIRVSVLEDGTLRIIRARTDDSGKYTCSAGSSSASSDVTVIAPTENKDFDSAPVDDHLDVTEAQTEDIDDEGFGFDEDLDSIVESQPQLLVSNRSPFCHSRHGLKLLPSPQPPPQVIRPQFSYVVSRPVLQVQPRGGIFANSQRFGLLGSIPRRDSHGQDQTSELVASILQFMDEEELDRTGGSLSSLLDQIVEVSSLHESGEINETERNRRNRNILSKLNLLLENNRDRVSPRGNSARSTKVVRLRRIVQILEEGQQSNSTQGSGSRLDQHPDKLTVKLAEEVVLPSHHIGSFLGKRNLNCATTSQVQFKPAAIIPQPTLVPLQLGRDVTAYVGGHLMVADAKRITILCEASGIPVPTITWFRNGNKLPEHRRQFVLLEGSLRLLYPQLSDSGVYKCVASNSGGNSSSSTDLSVMLKPRILSTTATLEDFTSDSIEATVGSDIRAKLGARVIIRCPTEGHPDPYVVWRKDASGLGQNTNVLADNSLEIYPATAAYQGLFGCEASNPAGSDYQASSLVLIDPPRISEDLNVLPDVDGAFGLPELLVTGTSTEHYNVKANSTVMMGCPVTGFPSPTITWLFNDQRLDEAYLNFRHQLMKEDKILQIAKADYSSEGTYSCLAQNDGGNLTTRLRLNLIVYTYQFGEFSPCSASCGGNGLHFKQLKCVQDGVKEVQEWYCTGLTRPTITYHPCNRIDCPPRLVVGSWSSCSATCGNGTRTRTPSCVILMSDGSTREVANEECVGNESRPIETEPCSKRKCPEWKTGAWKSCSRKCMGRGVGWKGRKVYCVDSEGQKVSSKHCLIRAKPKRKSLCPNLRCEPIWVTSRWSVCSHSCGDRGIKTRIANCVYRGRKKQPAGNQCSNHPAPQITLPCNRKSCVERKHITPKRRVSASIFSGSCTDKYSWCSRVKKLRLCTKKFHLRLCCRTCRNFGKR